MVSPPVVVVNTVAVYAPATLAVVGVKVSPAQAIAIASAGASAYRPGRISRKRIACLLDRCLPAGPAPSAPVPGRLQGSVIPKGASTSSSQGLRVSAMAAQGPVGGGQ